MFTKTLLSLSLTFFYTDSCFGSVSLISANDQVLPQMGYLMLCLPATAVE